MNGGNSFEFALTPFAVLLSQAFDVPNCAANSDDFNVSYLADDFKVHRHRSCCDVGVGLHQLTIDYNAFGQDKQIQISILHLPLD